MARAQSCRVLENGAILPLSLARAHTVGISTIFTEVKIKRSTSSKVSAAVLKTHAHKTSVNCVSKNKNVHKSLATHQKCGLQFNLILIISSSLFETSKYWPVWWGAGRHLLLMGVTGWSTFQNIFI